MGGVRPSASGGGCVRLRKCLEWPRALRRNRFDWSKRAVYSAFRTMPEAWRRIREKLKRKFASADAQRLIWQRERLCSLIDRRNSAEGHVGSMQRSNLHLRGSPESEALLEDNLDDDDDDQPLYVFDQTMVWSRFVVLCGVAELNCPKISSVTENSRVWSLKWKEQEVVRVWLNYLML